MITVISNRFHPCLCQYLCESLPAPTFTLLLLQQIIIVPYGAAVISHPITKIFMEVYSPEPLCPGIVETLLKNAALIPFKILLSLDLNLF